MKCSHGIPLECKCRQCADDALKLIRTLPRMPLASATKEERDAFWTNAYRQSVAPNVY